MRQTVDLIGDYKLDRTTLLILSEILAGQAVALAAYRREEIREEDAERWIAAVTGYPGVEMRKADDLDRTLGEYAAERLRSLIKSHL